MSFAIHLFMPDKFAEEPYLRFLGDVQNLFGKWDVAGSTPIHDTGLSIHDCFIESENLPPGENVRVNVMASRRHDAVRWNFDFEWYVSFETSAGRGAMSLAVQLGSLLLATQKFRWSVVVDRDSWIDENEPIEFRSKEALVEHIRRVI